MKFDARRQKNREKWMAQVEDKAVALCPDARGRIDWTTATHLFNIGKTVEEASSRLAELYKEAHP